MDQGFAKERLGYATRMKMSLLNSFVKEEGRDFQTWRLILDAWDKCRVKKMYPNKCAEVVSCFWNYCN